MVTGSQIRAARSFLGWSARQLAEASGVALQTVQRFEQHAGLPAARVQTLQDVISALEKAGVEFIGTPDEPGVILRRRAPR
ncbi:MAG: helix-turn-helix transcriptional regulator [Burkholderiales bacterium]|nr:helix-turn-helix transcriptional regulator [Burkholderiales bacterium]